MSRFPQQLTSNYINSLDPALPATGGPPTGVASGDLTGTYPGPFLQNTGVVAGTYGNASNVPQITLDAKGRVLTAVAVAVAGGPPSGAAGGDLTGTYPAPALANSGVVAGTYGGPGFVPQISVDSKGRLTGVTNVGVSGAVPAGPAGGDLAGTYPNPILATTGVTAGTYGNATTVAQVQVDTKGRVTGISNIPITGGGGGAPTGPAGGDLTGTYPNPDLSASGVSAGTFGTASAVSQIQVDTKGRVVSASNVPIVVAPSGSAGGDLTGTYPNPSLAASGATAGTFGGATQSAQFTVNTKGQITSVADVPIAVAPSGAAGGDLAGTYPNPTLGASGVAAGIYGTSTLIPRLTVDGKGRVTNATTVAVAGGAPTGAAGGDLSGTYPNPAIARIQNAPITVTAQTIDGTWGLPLPSPPGMLPVFSPISYYVEDLPTTDHKTYKGTFSFVGVLGASAAFLSLPFDASRNDVSYFLEVDIVSKSADASSNPGAFFQKNLVLISKLGASFSVVTNTYVVNNSYGSAGGVGATVTLNGAANAVNFNFLVPVSTTVAWVNYNIKWMGTDYP